MGRNLKSGKLTTATVKWRKQWQYKNRMGKILDTYFRSRFEGCQIQRRTFFFYMKTSHEATTYN